MSLHAVTDAASWPLNWRLYIPDAWDGVFADTNEDAHAVVSRLARAGIPEPPEYSGCGPRGLPRYRDSAMKSRFLAIRRRPANTPLKSLVRLTKMHWRIEHDYRGLKTGLGLDRFEGRSFNGFHRHPTLVTAAQLFITRKSSPPQKSQRWPQS